MMVKHVWVTSPELTEIDKEPCHRLLQPSIESAFVATASVDLASSGYDAAVGIVEAPL